MCMSLPIATISSVPIYDFSDANEEVAPLDLDTEEYYECCGKSACGGCIHSIRKSENEHSVRFAIPTEVTRQKKKWLRK